MKMMNGSKCLRWIIDGRGILSNQAQISQRRVVGFIERVAVSAVSCLSAVSAVCVSVAVCCVCRLLLCLSLSAMSVAVRCVCRCLLWFGMSPVVD